MKTSQNTKLNGFKVARCQGVSLVEIMVAMVLSLILLAGVGNIYVASKQTYRMQDGQSRLQENARHALETLTRDIRLSGYMGCQSSGNIKPVVIANAPLIAPWTASLLPANVVPGSFISGGNDATGEPAGFSNPSPSLSSPISTGVVRGTDAITVVYAEPCGGAIPTGQSLSTVNPATANLNANTCGGGTVGTPLLVADCETAHIFRAATDTTYNTGAGVATSALGKTYASARGAEIMRYRSYTYYIRCNNAGNCSGTSEPSLYRFDNNSNDSPDEVAEGVENMQILYGVDTIGDGSHIEYLPANSINRVRYPRTSPDWDQVVSVRLILTVRSVGESANNLTSKQNATRTFNGNAAYRDNRLYRYFTATISLRNH